MDEPLLLALAAVGGVALGVFFFGALWWTVRHLPEVRHPALLVFVSFLGRTAAVLAGFVLMSGGRWERVLACLAGFVLARQLLVRRFGTAAVRSQDS